MLTIFYKLRRKKILKYLKKYLDNPEMYLHYLNKMKILYSTYKNNKTNEYIEKSMNLYLKKKGYKTSKYFDDDLRENLHIQLKNMFNYEIDLLNKKFNKLNQDTNIKLKFLNQKFVTRTTGKSKSTVFIN